MNGFSQLLFLLIIIVVLFAGGLALYLSRPLKHQPQPGSFDCLDLNNGSFANFDTLPTHIYAVGLSYAAHIRETAAEFDPDVDPPIFKKENRTLTYDESKVTIPTTSEILSSLEKLEPGISQLMKDFQSIPALLDYETELGFVLLEDIDAAELGNEDYIPKIGFFMANDLSARSVAVLGEGQKNRYDYWGVSKSFEGFLPISDKIWIPEVFKKDAIPCIEIQTEVNGEIRQKQFTSDLIYTPHQMLKAIHNKYPDEKLLKGDLILTGTPGGVIFSKPRWVIRLANMVGIGRLKKLKMSTKDDALSRFLSNGDKVTVTGIGLGSVSVEISD